MASIDTTAAVEAAKTAAEFDYRVGGIMALVGAILMKLIDKLPLISRIFSGTKKTPVYKTDMDLAIAEHAMKCRECTDKRFADTLKELKEARDQEAKLREQDIVERREYRGEMLNSNIELRKEMVNSIAELRKGIDIGFNRVHLRIDGKADK